MNTFKALIADKTDEGTEISIKMSISITEGDVLIDVHYSSVIIRTGWLRLKAVPLSISRLFQVSTLPEVIESSDDRFNPGDKVIATSYKVGTGISGGL